MSPPDRPRVLDPRAPSQTLSIILSIGPVALPHSPTSSRSSASLSPPRALTPPPRGETASAPATPTGQSSLRSRYPRINPTNSEPPETYFAWPPETYAWPGHSTHGRPTHPGYSTHTGYPTHPTHRTRPGRPASSPAASPAVPGPAHSHLAHTLARLVEHHSRLAAQWGREEWRWSDIVDAALWDHSEGSEERLRVAGNREQHASARYTFHATRRALLAGSLPADTLMVPAGMEAQSWWPLFLEEAREARMRH